MKKFGHQNVRKHREIKGSDKYVTLDISLKFDGLDNMKIKSSELKKLERSGKGLIASLGFKAKERPHKYRKSRYPTRNFSKKDLSKIIREFKKLPYGSYDKNRPKHDPTDRYFYLARQLSKCMMRADSLNSYFYPVRTKMTALSLHICSTDEDESKFIIVHKTLSQSCYTDEDESKGLMVNETLSQSCYIEEDELCSTEGKKS